ncbi:MAG: glycerol-3-phosphate 1-O-acyltransferase PlsY [candidate division NC10 bacterium]|nr:glycerol-3-phosphate 1-O-acyltransferase PlsY [candidate division NC10 bacterium]
MIAGLLLCLVAYLLGAIPFGVIIARLQRGIDIRDHGSGNIGTSNVLRTLGKRAALLTLGGDLLKGYCSVLLGHLLGLSEPWWVAAGLAAIIGHNWPVYIGFRGGKGVATTFGAALALMPAIALLTLGVYLAVAALTRYTSLAALVGSASLLLWVHVWKGSRPQVLFCLMGAALIYVRHRENIQRLISGTERRIGEKVST